MGSGGCFLEVKQPNREPDHSRLLPRSSMSEFILLPQCTGTTVNLA